MNACRSGSWVGEFVVATNPPTVTGNVKIRTHFWEDSNVQVSAKMSIAMVSLQLQFISKMRILISLICNVMVDHEIVVKS